jgi:TolA-binding protein
MERRLPAGGFKGAGLGSLALAAALAVGPLTAGLRAAEPAATLKPAVTPAPSVPAPAPTPAPAPAPAVKAEGAKIANPAPATKPVTKPAPPPPTAEQIRQEQERRAAALLNDAKQAYEQKNYGPSVANYRQFLSQFPKRPEVMAAHYGLAMALAEMLDKDWAALINELQTVVASPEVADKGRAQYWLGVALRVTGEQQLEAAKGHPEQLAKAQERLAQAGAQFAAADGALVASVNPKPAADAKELPAAMEMAARAKVEGAEGLLKIGKNKEAAELVKVFASDPIWAKSAQRPAGLLALGQAQVALADYPGAFATLAQIAPFEQLGVGLNARYLLGRILQETGERPEAVVQYEAVFKGYLEQRRKAEEALKSKEAWRGRPIEQMRLEALTRSSPEYVQMSWYNAATIQFEYGQFTDAVTKYQSYLQAAPKSDLAPLAQLRQGICQVQLKQQEGARTLQPLMENPQWGDQASWWIGKLQRGLADPGNVDQQRKMVTAAIVTFGRAGERAAVLGKTDPAAAIRHGDILLDIADSYASIKQYKEAAPIYDGLSKDGSSAARAEIAHERLAMTLSKQGQFAASDAACAAFLQKYPASMLKPLVMFWQAENSYRQGVELAKKPEGSSPAVQEQVQTLQTKAAGQYQAVVEKYPEFAQASAARYGLGMSYYRQEQWEKAAKQLERILDADRNGELAAASYYQADCLMRTLPENADDALSAARLSGQLEESAKLLAAFVEGRTNAPEMPDAMLKLADCYQRNASILADQQEKAKTLQSARETYDKLLSSYPKHPAFAQAVMDRARCMAATGDAGGAINELNRFRNDGALIKSDVAPLALLRLSELMVRHGRAVDAAVMLEKARKDYEPQIASDPKRADWIPGLRYQHGLALKESGKLKEALALFEGIIKEFKDRPEAAEASLASIQVRKDEALNKLRSARQAVAAISLDKPVDEKLLANQAEAIKQVGEIANAFGEHADRIADKSAGSDLHMRTLRDAANSWRAIADAEIDTIRRARAEESLNKLKAKLAKDPKVGKSNSVPRPPEIKLASVPVQPAEQKARDYYNKALEAAPDSPVCNELRLELAQMYYDRGEADQAIQLLNAAIDRNPPPELLNQLHVKLGNAFLMKKDAAGAMKEALQALTDANSPLRPAAYLVKGRALALQKNWGEAITVLTRYRAGSEKYLNAGPVTEEGLLRLAEAYAASGNWSESLATYEHLIGRFGGSKWLPEARFGIGWAQQNLKQFDAAVQAYAEVTRRTSSEMAARAQLQIGLCRAEQKRWQEAVNELLVVPGTYDYAEWAAPASLAAGRALVELKQPAEAKDILKRVVRDHPGTEWAQQAEKGLAAIH